MRFVINRSQIVFALLLPSLTACMPLRTAQPELLSIVEELPNQYQVNATAQQYQPAPYQPEQWFKGKDTGRNQMF